MSVWDKSARYVCSACGNTVAADVVDDPRLGGRVPYRVVPTLVCECDAVPMERRPDDAPAG